jgi:pimeloyl-ACP methyl ester carboxylesterase
VVVGHSMAGLFLRVFAARNRERLAGVVLVDAVTPELGERRGGAAAIHAYRAAMRIVRRSAGLGYMRPVSRVIGDLIGLDGEASQEKRRIYGSAIHARWAAEEVVSWPATSAQGKAAGAFDPDLPVAVVTAGDAPSAIKTLQSAPAAASRAGRVEHVAGANHASLLGRRFADPIVAAVRHVLEAAEPYGSRSKTPQAASSRS